MFKIYDGREQFYQWDLDRKIIVEDETIKEVHFCNRTDDCSLVCEVYDFGIFKVANVPNILLQEDWRINVYGYNEKYTKYEKTFEVKRRSKPADYIYTETEIKTFALLEKRMEELENSVTEEGIEKAVGEYLEENPVEVDLTGYATEDFVNNSIDSTIPQVVTDTLQEAKESGQFDGKDGVDGKDGYTPIKNVDYFDGTNGKDGKDGNPGKDGVSVTHKWEGTTLSITSASGTSSANLKGTDGTNGTNGKDGYTPQKGIDYFDGTNGKDGVSCSHSWNGTTLTVISASGTSSADLKGNPGKDGANGTNGKDGYTPQKGIDYYTEAEKMELIQEVLNAIGTPVYGLVDENNNIIMYGELEDNTYFIKYEMEDGSLLDIGELVLDNNVYYTVTNNLTNCVNSNSNVEVIGGESYIATITANSGYELTSLVVTMGSDSVNVSDGNISIAEVTGDIVITAVAEEAVVEIVNLIPTSIDTDGSIYNGIGYKTNTRIRGTGEIQENYSGVSATGFIRAQCGDVVYLKGIMIENSGVSKVHPYDESKNACSSDSIIFSTTFTDEGNGVYSCTLTNANTAFIRVASKHIMDGSEIVTINKPIV